MEIYFKHVQYLEIYQKTKHVQINLMKRFVISRLILTVLKLEERTVRIKIKMYVLLTIGMVLGFNLNGLFIYLSSKCTRSQYF